MSNESKRRMILSLERSMAWLGNEIERKEKVLERFPNLSGIKLREDIERYEAKQDEINARLGCILSGFTVDYSGRGFFTCTNAEGSFVVSCGAEL